MYPARRIGIAFIAVFLILGLGQCLTLAGSLERSTAAFPERFNAAARALDVELELSRCEPRQEGRVCKHLLSGGAVLLANMAEDRVGVHELTLIFDRGADLFAIRRTIEVTMLLFVPKSTSDERARALLELLQPLTPLHQHREAVLNGVKWVLLSNLSSSIWVVIKQ
jgi:hypothetical protein